jgi:hypothetical protein
MAPREKARPVWESAKSALLLLTVTVMIWLVADQNVQEQQVFRIPVRVASRDPNRYVAFAKSAPQVVLQASMTGRRRHLKAFADLLSTTPAFEAFMDQSRAPAPEPQLLSSADDILRTVRAVQESHLAIRSVTPRTVSVLIDVFTEVPSLAVEPDFGDLKVTARCTPAAVSARLPRSAVGLLPPDRILRPDAAAILHQALKDNPESREFQIAVPMTLDVQTSEPVAFRPEKVTVTGVVETFQATAVKGPIQITFSIPAEVQEKFILSPAPGTSLRQNIEVTGPAGQLDRLEPQEIRAFVEVLAADMDEPGKDITRPVQYFLPPGFSLAAGSAPHTVTFQLTPRPTAAEPPAP